MPTHYWGDETFDWNSLYKAERELYRIMRVYGRISVHSKEKYGTLRFSISFFNGTLHSLTHPCYMYSRYPNWLWNFDVTNRPLKCIIPIVRLWQKFIVEYAFSSVCTKYPHILKEIIQDVPEKLLPPHLELIRAKMWINNCSNCDEMSTTDNYKCPHCGEIK